MSKESANTNLDHKSPADIAHTFTNTIGVSKANASFIRLILLGFLAGAYIAFGAAIATLVGHDAAEYLGYGVAKLFTGGAFSVGLMLVVVAGAELFTGNNLITMSALKGKVAFSKVAQKWAVVYLANFVGALFLVWIMFQTNLWRGNGGAIGVFALKIAYSKVNLTLSEAIFRAILCNWLVCLAVWMSMASKDIASKILAIFFPIMTFAALGFEHCIANMYFIPFGLLLKKALPITSMGLNLSNLTAGNFILRNLIPVTIGNMIGGIGFVATLYWLAYIRKRK